MTYAEHLKSPTPQSQPIPGRAMVENAAGGYVFEVDDWQRLRRFLILGCAGGTYYEGERKLTLEAAEVVKRCVAADGLRAVDLIVEVSDQGHAVKNEAAIFALAVASKFGDDGTRARALRSVPKVCRIGTHLFQFAEARQALGAGWGRGARHAVGRWYDREDLVLQALKYQQRGGWSHRDLLRLSHPKLPKHAKVLDAICRPEKWAEVDHPLARGYLALQKADVQAADAARIISEYQLPRELVPTAYLNWPEVWEALLPHMGLTALVRNLGNLSKAGVLKPLSDAYHAVCARLADRDGIRRSRLHPFSILLAARTYARGAGVRGSGSWTVVPQVVAALDSAYDLAFVNVEPTGKRLLLAVDVSGSMSWPTENAMTCAEAAAAMAMATVRVEPQHFVMGFASDFRELGITPRDSLVDVLRKTKDLTFGSTDTSVAMRWALQHKVPVDAFVVYTDNETWSGDQHTCEALRQYRQRTGLATKLAVVAFTSTRRSVADGADPGSMDFVGLDASLPAALAAFVRE